MIALGKRIRYYRKLQKISIEELAERCTPPLHYNYLGGVERGEYNLTLLGLLKISRGLNIPLVKLLDDIDVNDNKSEKELSIDALLITLKSMDIDQIEFINTMAKEVKSRRTITS